MPDALTAALAKHLCDLEVCSIPTCADHWTTAGAALKFLAAEGALLPPGIAITGASNGGQRAWRIRAEGVDVTTRPEPLEGQA